MLQEHFAKHYELYGRKVEWVDYESRFGNDTQEIQGRGREGACLDAEVVANELKAFAVVGERAAVSKPFADCAAQRGVVVLNGASYASEKFYRDRHPYVWAIITDCERINYQVGEYVGKRLVGRPAKWAGDPALAKQTRKFGVYTPVGDGEDDTCAQDPRRDGRQVRVRHAVPLRVRARRLPLPRRGRPRRHPAQAGRRHHA